MIEAAHTVYGNLLSQDMRASTEKAEFDDIWSWSLVYEVYACLILLGSALYSRDPVARARIFASCQLHLSAALSILSQQGDGTNQYDNTMQPSTLTPDQVLSPRHVTRHMRAAAARKDIRLTHRQREILRYRHAGQRPKHIARLLGIAVSTVRSHIRTAVHTLGVSGAEEAAIAAHDLGLLRAHQD